jgi:CHAT domain-containing protein
VSSPEQCYLSDFAVSSYIPTIGSLLEARSVARCTRHEEPKAFIIAEPDAEEHSPLPNASGEIDLIKRKFTERANALDVLQVEMQPRVTDVLDKIQGATIIHLACHGHQDRDEPLSSGFTLRDGRLTISDIMRLKLRNARFAFLSACESAAGDREQPDEAIHLGAAMLFMGVKSVVGTLWFVLTLTTHYVSLR